MSQAPENRIAAICPHCGKTYALPAGMVGRSARCAKCNNSFNIAPGRNHAVPAPPGPSAGIPAAQPSAATLCPVCQSPFAQGEAEHFCPTCKTRHHADCWEYNRGCGLYGCREAPPTDKLQDVEIPASFWGQTEKKCPRCQKVIQAAAVRCRHCGTEFESARPQDIAEFQTQRQVKQSLPMHSKIAVILLVAAVIPCFSPFAAIAGLIWYFVFRKQILALPAMNLAIARIAVAVAIGVTLMMVILGGVYSALH